MSAGLRVYARFVARHPLVVLALTALAGGFLIAQIRHLSIGMHLDDFLPQSHPNVAIYREIRKIFGVEKTVLVIVRGPHDDVFEPAALHALAALTRSIEKLPGVLPGSVLSVASRQFKRARLVGDALDVEPLMAEPPATQAEADRLRAQVLEAELYRELLVSRDGRTAAVVAGFRDTVPSRTLHDQLTALVRPLREAGYTVRLGGPPILDSYLERYSARIAWILPLTLLVVAIVHYEAFRTAQAIFLPLLTALVSVLLSLGTMGWLGFQIDPWNAVTPVIILAIAAGHAVQILKRYYEELARGRTGTEAIVESLVCIGPVMLTAGGVAVAGFASLTTFNVPSVRAFGAMLAAGVAATLVVEFTLIPAIRVLLPDPRARERRGAAERSLATVAVDAMARQVMRRPGLVLVVWVLCLPLAVVGLARIRVNNDYVDWFYPGTEARTDNDAINDEFAGTATFHLLVRGAEAGSLLDPRVVAAIADLQAFMRGLPGIGKALSYVDLVREMQKTLAGDAPPSELPRTAPMVAQYLLMYEFDSPDELSGWIDGGRRWALVTAFSRSAEDEQARRVLGETRAFVVRRFAGLPAAVEVGAGVMGIEAAINEIVVREKLVNVLVIAVVVLVLSALAFRSAVAGLLVLTPLAFAVLVDLGVMGWTGMWLSMATAAITAMGVSVGADFAIYLLYRIREEAERGSALEAAVRQALATAGHAVSFVSLAIVAGYLTLLGAGFRTWSNVAVLTSLMIGVSALSTLTMIPALVLVARPRFLTARRAAPAAIPVAPPVGAEPETDPTCARSS